MKTDYNGSQIFESLESEELGEFTLEEFIRSSAQQMLSAAVAEEVTEYLQRGHRQRSEMAEGFRGYRNGFLPERKISTSVGTLVVRQQLGIGCAGRAGEVSLGVDQAIQAKEWGIG